MTKKLKLQEIGNGNYFVKVPGLNVQLDDDKDTKLGLYVEVLDMLVETGEEEFENYPFIVSIGICAENPHKSFSEQGGETDKLSLIYDTNSYMGSVPVGSVPVGHVLANGVNGGLKEISKQFSVDEATVITDRPKYGAVAAQEGPGSEHKYLRFATEEAALKYVDLLLERANVLSVMIGFILDRPINMVGDDGWGVIRKQVEGK